MNKFSFLFAFFLSFFLSINTEAQHDPVKFQYKVVKLSETEAELQFIATVQDKWHLYSQTHDNGIEHPIKFTFTPSNDYERIGKVWEPKPKTVYDSVFKDTSRYFEKKVTFKQKVIIKNNNPFTIKGKIEGQACENLCVQIDRKFSFDVSGFEGVVDATTQVSQTVENNTATTESPTISETNTTADTREKDKEEGEEESLLKFFALAFLGGLVGLLTPCVFPMIPMTISYFMKSTKNARFHAIVYGLSIIAIYVLFGIILSIIFGPNFSNILSTHWIPNILFAVIFIIFAISLFGYFDIALPSKWVNKSAKMESTGGLIGVFFMALTLVLVSFSCTLPIAGAVALNAAGGSFFKPIIGMLGFSLAFALPFTLFAFFPSMLGKLPKSGGWMNTLKVILAFVELAFALKFLNVPDQTYHWGLLDREVYLAFWIVIFTLLGFYLLGKIRFPLDNEMPYQKSWVRFFLAIFTFTFVIYMIPGMWGAPLKKLSGWLPPTETQDFDVHRIVREEGGGTKVVNTTTTETPKYKDQMKPLPHGIKGYFDYEQALRVAKEQKKPVFLDFTGHGCVNCRNVENAVWIDKRIRERFANDLIVLTLYVDDKKIKLDPEDQIKDKDGELITELGAKNMFIQNTIYKENAQPCYLVIDTDGSVLAGPIYKEMNVEKYLQFLDAGIKAYQDKYATQD